MKNQMELIKDIDDDLRCLAGVVRFWKEISEDKWADRMGKFNQFRIWEMQAETSELIYHCKLLLEQIETIEKA